MQIIEQIAYIKVYKLNRCLSKLNKNSFDKVIRINKLKNLIRRSVHNIGKILEFEKDLILYRRFLYHDICDM